MNIWCKYIGNIGLWVIYVYVLHVWYYIKVHIAADYTWILKRWTGEPEYIVLYIECVCCVDYDNLLLLFMRYTWRDWNAITPMFSTFLPLGQNWLHNIKAVEIHRYLMDKWMQNISKRCPSNIEGTSPLPGSWATLNNDLFGVGSPVHSLCEISIAYINYSDVVWVKAPQKHRPLDCLFSSLFKKTTTIKSMSWRQHDSPEHGLESWVPGAKIT